MRNPFATHFYFLPMMIYSTIRVTVDGFRYKIQKHRKIIMELKEEFMALQYQVIKKMFPDKEIYLVKDTISGQLLLKKERPISGMWIYQKIKELSSVHLPKIADVVSREDKLFVYEEYLQGMRLDQMMCRGTLSKKQAVDYVIQLCSLLQLLHAHGMIHRDIQPKNIIVTNDGIVKLLDFGNARMYVPGKSRDTVLMGTAGYAAPEQFGIEQTDASTDIYALGVLLNKMLTGYFPNEQLYDGRHRLRQIILKCIEIDKSRRYSDALSLLQDLKRGEKGYRWKRFVQAIPGFRPQDRHPWAIRLLAYPFIAVAWSELTKGIKSMMKLNTPQNILWYLTAMFFTVVLPFILLSNMWELDTRILHLHKHTKGTRFWIRFCLAYVSMMVLGVMLAIHYAF